jgi:hypothetical protein
MNFCQSLFVSVNQGLWEERKMFVNLRQGFGVIARQRNLFPQIFGRVGALHCFHKQANTAVIFSDSRVFAVGEWATGAITEARDGIGVSAKVRLVRQSLANGCFEGTKLVVYNLPYHFIVLHD